MTDYRPPQRTSQSFSYAEVQAMQRLFARLDTVPDTRQMTAGDEVLSVRRKFLAMHAKHVSISAAIHDASRRGADQPPVRDV